MTCIPIPPIFRAQFSFDFSNLSAHSAVTSAIFVLSVTYALVSFCFRVSLKLSPYSFVHIFLSNFHTMLYQNLKQTIQSLLSVFAPWLSPLRTRSMDRANLKKSRLGNEQYAATTATRLFICATSSNGSEPRVEFCAYTQIHPDFSAYPRTLILCEIDLLTLACQPKSK
ncbi:hypothetical protein SCHPADRAFT_689361 [Schizopora paradoxa]|uniref:Uncharacterized protein n=1 Tax=Schizopora paradoxa TaxID=27342 RepID=A0A0H2R3U7_9AGAM|nr:hypothetical protein SCHPADRAFT_689361 [Schizopora paradoxa]